MNLELVSKAPQPDSLPGGDDCCNGPIADPGFDELAQQPAPEADDLTGLLDLIRSVRDRVFAAHEGVTRVPAETVCPALVLAGVVLDLDRLMAGLEGVA